MSEDSHVERLIELIEGYLQQFPSKRRKEKLAAFQLALDRVHRKWAVVSSA